MGQKVNPNAFRLIVRQNYQSRWFAGKDMKDYILIDYQIRESILKILNQKASVSKIEIERSVKHIEVIIYTARPGMVIGRSGSGIDTIKKAISKFTKQDIKITIEEIRKYDLDPKIVADTMAAKLEKRMPFKKVLKQVMETTMKAGALGVKAMVSGRLNGAEMARTESLTAGSIPLHTIKANIAYDTSEARTTYGVIGVKVWIYLGE